MQYFKPAGSDLFFGDPMPFWLAGRFHLFWALDKNHHAEHDGLGGHVWAHHSSADLIHWEEHPIAIPLGPPGTCDEHCITTGCVIEHEGLFHAFYATRIRDAAGNVTQNLCAATSRDLIHFEKWPENPLHPAPPGHHPRHFRDPMVFRDPHTGVFHMLITACHQPPPVPGQGGTLAHLTSPDLKAWQYQDSFILPGNLSQPECPDHFEWNGWWYLLYSRGAETEYRISRSPLGPWQRAGRDTLEGPSFSVAKTAWFPTPAPAPGSAGTRETSGPGTSGGGRRIAVGFLPWLTDQKDTGARQYAGNAIFRELIQRSDGTLDMRFPPEMMPATGDAVRLDAATAVMGEVKTIAGGCELRSMAGMAMAKLGGVPADAVIRVKIDFDTAPSEFGLMLRTDADMAEGYGLRIFAQQRKMSLHRWTRGYGFERCELGVTGLDGPVTVAVCMKDSIIDVCVNEQRTMVTRCFEFKGTHLGLLVRGGAARFLELDVRPLASA